MKLISKSAHMCHRLQSKRNEEPVGTQVILSKVTTDGHGASGFAIFCPEIQSYFVLFFPAISHSFILE